MSVTPYTPTGNATLDALGTFCTGFYTALFVNNSGIAGLAQYASPDIAILQSPSLPYNASVFTGAAGVLSVSTQQDEIFEVSPKLTITVYAISPKHCIASGLDPQAKLVNSSETFKFEYLEETTIVDSKIIAAKPYFYHTYPVSRAQILEKDKHHSGYVAFKDHDVAVKDAQLAAYYATHNLD